MSAVAVPVDLFTFMPDDPVLLSRLISYVLDFDPDVTRVVSRFSGFGTQAVCLFSDPVSFGPNAIQLRRDFVYSTAMLLFRPEVDGAGSRDDRPDGNQARNRRDATGEKLCRPNQRKGER
jgi:hypothetical protein